MQFLCLSLICLAYYFLELLPHGYARTIPSQDLTSPFHRQTSPNNFLATRPAFSKAKRTQPTPSAPYDYQSLFTTFEQAGWTWQFIPDGFFSPILTSSASLIRYYNQCMALVAAQMLANVPLNHSPLTLHPHGPLFLTVAADHRCPATDCRTSILTWETVYYLLLYLRNHAERGWAGTGTLILGRRGRVGLMAKLRVLEGFADGRNECGTAGRC